MPLASCRIEGNWAVGKGGATERLTIKSQV